MHLWPRAAHTLRTLLCLAFASHVHATQVCEIDGQSVNSNGNTTAGKTGLMRRRDADDGRLLREQELRNGVFMGVVRYYREGILQREQINERGYRDGLSRDDGPVAHGLQARLARALGGRGRAVDRAL